MKKSLVVIGLVLVLLLPVFFSSCSSSVKVENAKAKLGEQFTLKIGQTAEIEGEYIAIQFVEVTADSRCPNYAKCVVAGEAKCRMRMTIMDSPAEMILTQLGGTASTGTDYFINFKIDFKLEPYPEMGVTMAPAEYRLIMTVTKP